MQKLAINVFVLASGLLTCFTSAHAQATSVSIYRTNVENLATFVSEQPRKRLEFKYRNTNFVINATPHSEANPALRIILSTEGSAFELHMWDRGLLGKVSYVDAKNAEKPWSAFQKYTFGEQRYQDAVMCAVMLKMEGKDDCMFPELYD